MFILKTLLQLNFISIVVSWLKSEQPNADSGVMQYIMLWKKED